MPGQRIQGHGADRILAHGRPVFFIYQACLHILRHGTDFSDNPCIAPASAEINNRNSPKNAKKKAKGSKGLPDSQSITPARAFQHASDRRRCSMSANKACRHHQRKTAVNPGEKRSQNKNAKQDSHSILTYLGSCIQKKCISHTVQHLFKACFFLPSKIHGSKQYRYQNSRIGRSLGTERKNIETKRPSCHSKEASYQRCGNIQILKQLLEIGQQLGNLSQIK